MNEKIPVTSSQSETGMELPLTEATLVDEVYTPEQQASDAERYRVTRAGEIVESVKAETGVPLNTIVTEQGNKTLQETSLTPQFLKEFSRENS